MRKVSFKKWVPHVRATDTEPAKPGYHKEVDGLFHQWGHEQDREEQYPVAIIEWGNGQIALVHPSLLSFKESPV